MQNPAWWPHALVGQADGYHRMRWDVGGKQEESGEGVSCPITTWKGLQACKTQEENHEEATATAPWGPTRVRHSVPSCTMIRSYYEASCWHWKEEATWNSSIMKIQFISFCPWELESLREYLEGSVLIKGAEGLHRISEDQNSRNHVKL